MPTPEQITARFDARAAAYRKGRPGYPAEAARWVVAECGWRAGDYIAELGAGTGQFTGLLLSEGLRVLAIEPNDDMRAALEHTMGGRNGFNAHSGHAEDTRLPPASMAGVVAAQAFHWFDPAAAAAECRRIAAPESPAAVLWNMRRTAGDAFHRAYEQFLQDWGTDYEAASAAWNDRDRLQVFYGGGHFSTTSFEHAQTLDEAGLFARIASCSYMPGVDDRQYEAMRDAAKELFADHADDGQVRLIYDCVCHAGPMEG